MTDYSLGIDIGTSCTTAAICRGGREARGPAEALSLGTRSVAAPSTVYVGEDGTLLLGEAAERRAGTQPGRAVREFKRRVGDAVPVVVGDRSLAAEDLLAQVAAWVVELATEREGDPPRSVVLTHPAGWGEHRLARVRAALTAVGLDDVTLLAEPVAAALHHQDKNPRPPGTVTAVYDLGGGTFDAAVVRRLETGYEVLGTPPGASRGRRRRLRRGGARPRRGRRRRPGRPGPDGRGGPRRDGAAAP